MKPKDLLAFVVVAVAVAVVVVFLVCLVNNEMFLAVLAS